MGIEIPNRPIQKREAIQCKSCGATHNKENCPYCNNLYIEPVHISNIRGGDTILHNGEVKTISYCDIKYNEFMGVTIFGDSYNLGYKKVVKVHFNKQ